MVRPKLRTFTSKEHWPLFLSLRMFVLFVRFLSLSLSLSLSLFFLFFFFLKRFGQLTIEQIQERCGCSIHLSGLHDSVDVKGNACSETLLNCHQYLAETTYAHYKEEPLLVCVSTTTKTYLISVFNLNFFSFIFIGKD